MQAIVFDTITLLGRSKFIVKSARDLPTGRLRGFKALQIMGSCLAKIIQLLPKRTGHTYCDLEKTLDVMCRLSICDRQHNLDSKARPCLQRGLQAVLVRSLKYFLPGHITAEFIRLLVQSRESPMRAADSDEDRRLGAEFTVMALRHFIRSIRASTQSDHPCQVQPTAQIGDKAVLIKGCEVPYLLRPVNNNNNNHHHHQFVLVGNCSVHGILYGEDRAEKGAKVQEIEIIRSLAKLKSSVDIFKRRLLTGVIIDNFKKPVLTGRATTIKILGFGVSMVRTQKPGMERESRRFLRSGNLDQG